MLLDKNADSAQSLCYWILSIMHYLLLVVALLLLIFYWYIDTPFIKEHAYFIDPHVKERTWMRTINVEDLKNKLMTNMP